MGLILLLHSTWGDGIQEDFSTDPTAGGWEVHGEGSLFDWDDMNEVLRVTWDSSQANSYFHLPLNTVLTRTEDFEASFDLKLDDIAVGTSAGKPQTFQIAFCLFNMEAATRTNFFIGAGTSSSSGPRSSVEFNYFPAYEDPFFGDITATFAAITVPTNTNPFLFHHDFPRELDTGVWHRVTINYNAALETVTLSKTRAGIAYGDIQTISLPGGFGDFRIDTFAITSYSDQVGLGSVLAHGLVDNIQVMLPDPPISTLTLTVTNGPQMHFLSNAGWDYTLERSQDLVVWSLASTTFPGTGSSMMVTDTNPPVDHAFYRVRAERP